MLRFCLLRAECPKLTFESCGFGGMSGCSTGRARLDASPIGSGVYLCELGTALATTSAIISAGAREKSCRKRYRRPNGRRCPAAIPQGTHSAVFERRSDRSWVIPGCWTIVGRCQETAVIRTIWFWASAVFELAAAASAQNAWPMLKKNAPALSPGLRSSLKP